MIKYIIKRKRKGFTLAEAILATMILGIAAAGVLLPFTAGASVRAEGQRQTLAAKLAADMMERMIIADFDEIVSTYHGYSEPKGQVKDGTGAVFSDPAYANFSRDVTCEYVYLPQQGTNDAASVILVTVTVYYENYEVVCVKRLISK